MIRIRKMGLFSFFAFMLSLMLCVNGSFAYAENDDYAQEVEEWREFLAGKWAPFEKLDLDSEWFTGYRLPANVYVFMKCPMSRMPAAS